MATEKQIAANRANARRSTGPKTAAGKLKSSGNAYRHGLSGPVPSAPETLTMFHSIARELTGEQATQGRLKLAADFALAHLGGVDSKDSLLGANQIQSCFWGGSLGCEEPFGFERCGVGADGAADHRSA